MSIVKVNKMADLFKGLDMLKRSVLVGVPQDKIDRNDDAPNNATLAYTHEFGSPAKNIPARPFLMPGIKSAQDKITARFQKATIAALESRPSEVNRQMQSAGMEARDAVKNKIDSGDFAPLSPATIAARARGRQTKSQRQSEMMYAELRKTMSEEDAQALAGIKPLVNTGQMRNSITYVVTDGAA